MPSDHPFCKAVSRPQKSNFVRLTATIPVFLSLLVWGCGSSEDDSFSPTDLGGPDAQMNPVGNWVEQHLFPADENQLAATLDPHADPAEIAAELGLTILDEFDRNGTHLVLFETPQGFDIEELRSADGVTAADQNQEVNLAEAQTLVIGFFEGEWDEGDVIGQDAMRVLQPYLIHPVTTGEDILIAVLDTGAYFDHPWLVGHLQALPDDVGLVSDEVKGWEDEDEDGVVDEAFGHGTHVAGCIAMLAPGATVMPIRVLNDDGVGSLYDILRGFELAAEFGADVINLSLSLSEPAESMEGALQECYDNGVTVVAAAGNHGWRNASYPGTSEYCVGAGAVDQWDVMPGWSGAGDEIDLAAPGVAILSAYPRADLWWASGTSMAAPFISAAVALVMEGMGVSGAEAVQQLKDTAVSIHPMVGVETGRISPVHALGLGQ